MTRDMPGQASCSPVFWHDGWSAPWAKLQFQYLLSLAEVRLATLAYLVAVVVQVGLFFPLVNAWGVVGMALAVLCSTTALTATQTGLLHRRTQTGLRPYWLRWDGGLLAY